MQDAPVWSRAADVALYAMFLLWLIWLPLPFGSIIDAARLPLVCVPLALCALSALATMARVRGGQFAFSRAWRIWSGGAVLFAVVIALQLVPLPRAMLTAVSPESAAIWAGGDRIASLAGQTGVSALHPVSIDPGETWRELFRMLALLAAFQTAALLVRSHARRVALALALVAAAVFEALYGVSQAASGRYEIWGWKNKLILYRVTGTFVNPNHFAHYVALALPFALFLAASAWHASAPGARFARRVSRLVERRIVPFAIGVLGAVACLAAILVAQSRGALVAAFGGLAITGIAAMTRSRALRSSRRRRALLAAGGTAAFFAIVLALVLYIGRERTVARFTPTEGEALSAGGRRTGIDTAVGVWKLFPILGSGAGTFPEVSGMTQTENLDKIFDHAHDDYAEVLATTGALGFAVAFVALLAGWWALLRATFGRNVAVSFSRRSLQAAALTSVTIAMVHALVDFNFYMPSNPATLAAIAGAAVSLRWTSLDVDAPLEEISGERIRQPDVDAMESP
jgi:O-antigen ligase